MKALSLFPMRYETVVTLTAPPGAVFSYLDEFHNLSAHMEKSSAWMLGSRMSITTDDGGGRAVGSKVRMQGKMLGIPLSLEEVVTERRVAIKKTWQTVQTNLLVIGAYQLGFCLTPTDAGATQLRVFIDYELPSSGISHWLGKVLGGMYARWCVERMAKDAAAHFHSAQA